MPEFEDRLKRRADNASWQGSNSVAAGLPGEQVIDQWQHGNIICKKMPDDPQKVLRISVGGLAGLGAYCVMRGDIDECVKMLRDTIEAIEARPE